MTHPSSPASHVPFVIGHRGAAGNAPENTLASIRKAAELGARWVEFDVMLSADDVPILFHDDKLERLTGIVGLTAETTWSDLQKMDAGSWFAREFAGEPIASFDQALALLVELDLGAVVEIKPSAGREIETGEIVAAAVRDRWPSVLPSPIVSSFSEAALIRARAVSPGLSLALNDYTSLKGWRARLEALGCASLHCSHKILRQKTAAAVLDAGYGLRCFTVNKVRTAEKLRAWGVHSVFTDFPGRIAP